MNSLNPSDENPGVSGLTAIPGAAMLHQAHQARMVDSPGNRYINFFNFDSMLFGQPNRVRFNPLAMVVEDAWIKMTVTRTVGSADTDAYSAYLPPPGSWVGDNGIQWLFNDQEVYKISEPESRFSDKIVEENFMRQVLKNEAADETDDVTLKTLWNGTAWNATKTRVVYLHIRAIAEGVMANQGALGAYAANIWSLSLDLLPLNRLATTGSSITDATGKFTISAMQMMLIGHAEDSSNMQRVSKALALDGVKLVMEAPYRDYISLSATSTTIPYTLSFPQLEGELVQIWMIPRYSAGLTTSDPTAVARSSWLTKADALLMRVSIGTKTQPQALWGQIMAYDDAKLLCQGYGYSGGLTVFNRVLDTGAVSQIAGAQNGTDPFAVTAWGYPVDRFTNTNALIIPLEEKGQMGKEYGTYSGSLRISHDFQIQVYVDSNLSAAVQMDVILFVRRNVVIGHESIKIVNEV